MKVKDYMRDNYDVNNNDLNDREQRYVRIEGTPFSAVLNDNDKWIILIGNAKVNSWEFESLAQAKDYVFMTDWDMMMTFVLKILEVCDIDINKFKGE